MTLMSDIATRYDYNPDPFFDGCQATHEHGPGVVFPSIEPDEGTLMFLGETALIEAVGALYEVTPDEVRSRFNGSHINELSVLRRENQKLKSELAKWEALKDSLADTGLLITAFDS